MDGSATDPRFAPLRRSERLVLVIFFFIIGLFALLVEHRSAFQHTRKGDLNVFLRAGWAVRTGADLYAVTDDNGFHYHYPPLLAILAAPLADPPAGADRTGMLPYAVSVAVCYFLNLFFLAFAVHHLAQALEWVMDRRAAGPPGLASVPGTSGEVDKVGGTDGSPGHRLRFNWPVGSRGWWALRWMPILACVIPIGHTLSRGQVNLLLLALFAGFLADLLYKRLFRAGLWLSMAVCVKVIPVYLLLFPLWRRDGRCLAGCAAGLVLGLVLIPVLFLGPRRTLDCYHEMMHAVLLPGLGSSDDPSRAAELTNQTATEGQSILTVLHNTLHYDLATRPPKASPTLRGISYVLGGLLTLAVLGAFGWRQRDDGVAVVLFFGLLVLNMLLISPVCHLHYYSLLLPLVMALMVDRWQKHEGVSPGPGLAAVLFVNGVGNLLPQLPDMNVCRDCGSAMYGSLLLWLMGVVVLWRRRAGLCAAVQREGFTLSRRLMKSCSRGGDAGTFRQRLFHGVRRLRQQPHWPEFAGPNWDEHIMQAKVTDRLHAKQGRTIARWTLGKADRQLVVYLKRHYRLPWRHRLLALLWPEGDWSPAMQEWRHLEWAHAAGLLVPTAAAGGEFIGPWGRFRSFLAVEELTGMLALHEAVPLAAKHLDPLMFRRWKRGLIHHLAALAHHLHDRRCFHKDFYLCHFYIAEEDTRRLPEEWSKRVWLIDLHRLAHHRWTWPWWRIKDLAQLLYSSDVPGVDVRDRLEFWRVYFGSGRRQRSLRWLRRIILLQAWNYQRRHQRRLRRRR